MTSYRDELDWAYHGEVIGEAMFGAMAEAAGDPGRAAQMGLLALIERQTKEQLAPLLERDGIVRHDEPYEAKGRALGERANRPSWDWERFLRTFEPTTQPALVRYRWMRDELAPDGDAQQMRSLVAHEEVLQAFADALLGGEQDPARRLVAALEASTGPKPTSCSAAWPTDRRVSSPRLGRRPTAPARRASRSVGPPARSPLHLRRRP